MSRRDSGTAMNRENSPIATPVTPTLPHSYESFSDLVNSSPGTSSRSRRNLFSSVSSSTHPERHRLGSDSNLCKNESNNSNTKGGIWSFLSSRTQSDHVDDDDDDDEDADNGEDESSTDNKTKSDLSTWTMIGLTIGLAGAQLTWTVEMAFGTPYLLSLGLTKQSTSLVWLAGPLSGLLVQPAIGALSDASNSRYRRRAFIATSALCVILSTLVVAYARALAGVLSSFSGLGDWDPEQEDEMKSLAIVIAVVAFYVLDFSLNGLQATLRALILDRSPSHQQNNANAWHGRMTHLANIFGYLAGYIDLGHWSGISWVGGGQFRKLAVISCSVMVVLVSITCWTQPEEARPKIDGLDDTAWSKLRQAWVNVRDNIKDLPVPVRRVCYVQFFAWTAFFPFLFYSTTYVAEVFYSNIPPGDPVPSPDTATRAGSLALLLFALVALVSGAVIPFVSSVGDKNFFKKCSRTSRLGRCTRDTLSYITLRNIWTVGLSMYAIVIAGTFFVSTPGGAKVVIALIGVPWAINCWVPFALVMESIREMKAVPEPGTPKSDPPKPQAKPLSLQPFRAALRPASLSRASSLMTGRDAVSASLGECSPLLRGAKNRLPPRAGEGSNVSHRNGRRQSEGSGFDKDDAQCEPDSAGGTILGIHNLAIVAPQFFVAIAAAAIFKILGAVQDQPVTAADDIPNSGESDGLRGSNDVVWVLRFGGLAAIGGAFVSRWLIKTKSESSYVKALRGEGESGLPEFDHSSLGSNGNV